jgi:hypothetical protein
MIKEEDKVLLMSIWRRSDRGKDGMQVLVDMFKESPQEIRRVINEETIKMQRRIQENTKVNSKLYS